MKPTISDFIAFLKQHELVNPDITNNVKDWTDRNRIQNLSRIAVKCGCDLGYEYSRHLCGPNSLKLASDLEFIELENTNQIECDKFISLVKGKQNDWIELAASIIDATEREETSKGHFYSLKPDHAEELIDSVFDELEAGKFI